MPPYGTYSRTVRGLAYAVAQRYPAGEDAGFVYSLDLFQQCAVFILYRPVHGGADNAAYHIGGNGVVGKHFAKRLTGSSVVDGYRAGVGAVYDAASPAFCGYPSDREKLC